VKTYSVELYKVTYTIDFYVLILFFSVSLDIISTLLFIIGNSGSEANVILKELIPLYIWFAPVYLFLTNAFFIPFLSTFLRKTFSYTFSIISILLTLNNFSLILFKNAFLVDTIGFKNLLILFFLIGISIFVYFTRKDDLNKKEILFSTFKLCLFVLFISLIHLLFFIISWL